MRVTTLLLVAKKYGPQLDWEQSMPYPLLLCKT